MPAVNIANAAQIKRNMVGSTPKASPNPPQTPANILFCEERCNVFMIYLHTDETVFNLQHVMLRSLYFTWNEIASRYNIFLLFGNKSI